MKPEIEGLNQELEQEKMKLADLKKQFVRNKEENVMTRMQNDELRRQIGQTEDNTQELSEKRIKVNYDIDNVYNDIFVKNDTLKLYDKTIEDLTRANEIE